LVAAPRLASLIEEGAGRLRDLPNPRLDAELLFLETSGWTRARLLTESAGELPVDLVAAFRDAIERRARHEPVQYIIGRVHFWRDEFKVTPDVLIPRPDSETLVETAAARLRAATNPLILDLGTGSGCLALSLLRDVPGGRVVAVDVSPAALEVAATNARTLGLRDRATFLVSSWYAALEPGERFDAIVSNPPYVDRSEESTLAREVRDFEPHIALFAEHDDDLSSYRAILSGAAHRLKPGGFLAVEVGAGRASQVGDLMRSSGFASIEIRHDLRGIERVVAGVIP
jgi:release factor glutamine methyltransferase